MVVCLRENFSVRSGFLRRVSGSLVEGIVFLDVLDRKLVVITHFFEDDGELVRHLTIA